MEPKLIEGGLAVDDRGAVSYVNDFSFDDVKRFYMVQNHAKGFVRAFHFHEFEAKYVYVVNGSIKITIVRITKEHEVLDHRTYTLSALKPSILYVPEGWANGFQTLTDDAKIIFYSTSTLEDSKNDDQRFPYDKWTSWEEDYR